MSLSGTAATAAVAASLDYFYYFTHVRRQQLSPLWRRWWLAVMNRGYARQQQHQCLLQWKAQTVQRLKATAFQAAQMNAHKAQCWRRWRKAVLHDRPQQRALLTAALHFRMHHLWCHWQRRTRSRKVRYDDEQAAKRQYARAVTGRGMAHWRHRCQRAAWLRCLELDAWPPKQRRRLFGCWRRALVEADQRREGQRWQAVNHHRLATLRALFSGVWVTRKDQAVGRRADRQRRQWAVGSAFLMASAVDQALLVATPTPSSSPSPG